MPEHLYDKAYLPKRRIQLTPEDIAIFAMHSGMVPTSKYIAMDHIDAAIMAKPDRLATNKGI